MYRFPHGDSEARDTGPEALPFPARTATQRLHRPSVVELGLPSSADAIFASLDTMSRRIDDLARELGLLDHDDDGPRAA